MAESDFDWKDSNIALIGSDEDKESRLKAAKNESNWKVVENNKDENLFIWRINKFKLDPVNKNDFGIFFSGDSYIVLKVKKVEEKLVYDIHFWIGSESTQDEYGTAAYKTVELDDFLKGAAIEHREVQGYESDLFKSYFESISILKGGNDSGFRKVTPNEFKPRLFKFIYENKKHIIQEVPFSRKSIHSADVYILDEGQKATQWNGNECNKDERFEAAKFCKHLESTRNGRCKASVIDERDSSESNEFKKKLPDVDVTESQKRFADKNKCIYKLTDESGKKEFIKVAENSCPRSVLGEDDVFVICGGSTCFVYIGENSSSFEKKNALIYAQNCLNKSANPFVPITVVTKTKVPKDFEKTIE